MIRHVSQHPHPKACQQAVIAMLAGVQLADVLAVVGNDALAWKERERACAHFGIKLTEDRVIVESVGSLCMGALIQKYPAVWVHIGDCRNVNFAHSSLIVGERMLDPHYGENPLWPWSHYMVFAQGIIPSPRADL
jgi:hypothetical protein